MTMVCEEALRHIRSMIEKGRDKKSSADRVFATLGLNKEERETVRKELEK